MNKTTLFTLASITFVLTNPLHAHDMGGAHWHDENNAARSLLDDGTNDNGGGNISNETAEIRATIREVYQNAYDNDTNAVQAGDSFLDSIQENEINLENVQQLYADLYKPQAEESSSVKSENPETSNKKIALIDNSDAEEVTPEQEQDLVGNWK